MTLRAWAATSEGVTYSCIDGRVEPPTLAAALAAAQGGTTTFGRPIGTDPESAYWVARERLWGRVEDRLVLWEFDPDDPSDVKFDHDEGAPE